MTIERAVLIVIVVGTLSPVISALGLLIVIATKLLG